MEPLPSTDPICGQSPRGYALLALNSITLATAIVVVPLRIYTRIKIVKSLWWDDFFVVLAFLLLIPTFGLIYSAVHLGIGHHIACVEFASAVKAGEYEYIAEVLEILSVVCARVSAGLFVTRLFGVTRGFRMAMYGYTIFMAVCLCVTAICVLNQCKPATALWDPLVKGDCWPAVAVRWLNYFNGTVSILSDVILALVPVYFIWKLQMPMRLKLKIVGLMGLGLITVACAIVRTILSVTQASKDVTYSTALLLVFGSTETSMAIIATTIPALPPLWSKRRRGETTKNSKLADSGNSKSKESAFNWPLSKQGHESAGYIQRFNNNASPSGIGRGTPGGDATHENGGNHNDDMTPLVPLNAVGKRVDVSIS